MASIRLYLDTRKIRKDGTYPLKVAVHHKGSFMINLNIYLVPEQWTGKEVVIAGEKHLSKSLNEHIDTRFAGMQSELRRLRAYGELPGMTDSDLKKALDVNHIEKEESPVLFKDRYAAYIVGLERDSTKSTFELMYKKVELFSDVETLSFEQMNYSWMKDFDRFLRVSKGLAVNSASIYLRNIRTIFNDAIDRDIIPQSLYPFRKFKIQHEKTRKRSLTIEQIKQLRDYPCEPAQEQYRDIFMLSFYLCGINMVDLCNLTEIRNGYIEYKRSKTGRLYEIKVEPEALAIINKYRGENYLLNILDRHKDYKNYLHRMNKNLHEIGPVTMVQNNTKPKGKRVKSGPEKKEKAGLFPGLSSYWSRHSWASIAYALNIPKETIAAALGHGGNTVTDIYISFDQSKIDKANRKVLNALKK